MPCDIVKNYRIDYNSNKFPDSLQNGLKKDIIANTTRSEEIIQ